MKQVKTYLASLHSTDQCIVDGVMIVTGYVIELGDRYFIEVKNNRVTTAWRHEAARVFCRKSEMSTLNGVIEMLKRRGKKPFVAPVGQWISTLSYEPEGKLVAV